MYPYHNKIKQRIKKGELITFSFLDSYKGIKPALLLFFSTFPHTRVIRNYRFIEYYPILEGYSLDTKIKEIKDLYIEVFKDGKSYTDEVFRSVYLENRVRFILDEGLVATFAFLLPKKLSFYGEMKDIVFLSAVATSPKKRRQGFMRRLIKNILDELYLKEYPFVTLSPANEDYYKSFGFRTVLRGKTQENKLNSENLLSIKKVENFNEFAKVYNLSSLNYDIAPIRGEDAEGTFKSHLASDIETFKVFDGDKYCGYFVFDKEDVYDYDLNDQDFCKINVLDGKNYTVYGEGESRYMVRIVCPEKALSGIKVQGFKPKTITVVDEFLNFSTNIALSEENGKLKAVKTQRKGEKITVEELTDWIFGLSNEKVNEIMGAKNTPKFKFLDRYL